MHRGALHYFHCNVSLRHYVCTDNGDMWYENDQLSATGDGLVMTDRYMFVSSWEAVGGNLLALDMWNSSAVFETVVSNLPGPADICLGPDNMVAIPSLTTGKVWFVQHSDTADGMYEPVESYPYEGDSSVCMDYMITTNGWEQNVTNGTYRWHALRFWMDNSGYGCRV